MSDRNVASRMRNKSGQGNRNSSSLRPTEFPSIRVIRPVKPPQSLILSSQLNWPSPSVTNRRLVTSFDSNLRMISIPSPTSPDASMRIINSVNNGTNSAVQNRNQMPFQINSPSKTTAATAATKMKIDSPPNTPLSVTSIMSIAPIQSNRAARKALSKARKENDSMIYIDGPQVYTCSECRTHLTSHDDIISKSFHGRHGRAYLFDQCVNVTLGPKENRRLMTGLHVVCDAHCKRCKRIVGWTYTKAYEQSQKYKEGKFVIEKINLHLEENSYYTISHPAGERDDRWRKRSMSWGTEDHASFSPRSSFDDDSHGGCGGRSPRSPSSHSHSHDMVYEYKPMVRSADRSSLLSRSGSTYSETSSSLPSSPPMLMSTTASTSNSYMSPMASTMPRAPVPPFLDLNDGDHSLAESP